MRPFAANRSFVNDLATSALFLALLGAATAPAVAVGAAIYIAGDDKHQVEVFAFSGQLQDRFNASFTSNDGFGVGDVNGDGADDVVVGGDDKHMVDIFDATGLHERSFDGSFTLHDALAVGDVNGDGVAEILIAGDDHGTIDIFDWTGTKLYSFDGGFSGNDGFAVGDLDGDGRDEIVIAGDETGNVDIFDLDRFAPGGTYSFHAAFSPGDALAVGDVDGDGRDEILIAGDVTEKVEVFDVDLDTFTHVLSQKFTIGFNDDDGFAVGDVDGDGVEDIVVGGNVTKVVDVFDAPTEQKILSFNGNFTTNDLIAVGTTAYPDRDGDGLLDAWETDGVIVDGVFMDLPGWGADPDHKDLFLELDVITGEQMKGTLNSSLTRSDIQAIKAAFRAAPIDAGGVLNPDGQLGINLWVDTGGLTDGFAAEDGGALSSCSDGIDNGPDGLVDTLDPDCLLGDNLGGGNLLPFQPGPYLDDLLATGTFYILKGDPQNFNPARRWIFRYAISGPGGDGSGGKGEVGGNDFVEFNHDPGTLMHEFGHTLGLRHGGDEDANCKPNYLSVMNYLNQAGIWQTSYPGQDTDGNFTPDFRIVDYSPPRIPGFEDGAGGYTCEDGIDNGGGDGADIDDPECAAALRRGAAVLPTLTELSLDETFTLDATDPTNRIAFTNGLGVSDHQAVGAPVDWDGDGDAFDTNVFALYIDGSDSTGWPSACNLNGTLFGPNTHHGFDDWHYIALNFRPFGDSADSAINPETEREQTLEELQQGIAAHSATDLAISKTAHPDPVVTGSELTYSLTVTNLGPHTTSGITMVDPLPTGTTFRSFSSPSDWACTTPGVGGQGSIACEVPHLAQGTEAHLSLVAAVDCTVPDGTMISNSASIASSFADPAPANNAVTAQTTASNPAPILTCPGDLEVECTGDCGISASDPQIAAFLTGASAIDNCPGTSIVHDAPSCFELGATTVTFVAIDSGGASSSCTAIVNVVDTTPPQISVVLSRDLLWPPNHKLATIVATVTVTDACDPDPSFVLSSITSSEPDNGLGDGDTAADIQGAEMGTPDTSFQLRSERSGTGIGRVYTIVYTASDKSGNTSQATVEVTVPHDAAGFAKGSAGLDAKGRDFRAGATTFELVVLSTPAFDATRIDRTTAQIGSTAGVIDALSSRVTDLNRDALPDRVFVFPVAAARTLRAAPGDDHVLAFRYGIRGEAYWLVPDILRLGPPMK